MRTSHDAAIFHKPPAHSRPWRSDSLASASDRFLRRQRPGARRSWQYCLTAGVLTERDFAQGDAAAGTVSVCRSGVAAQLACLPWSAPGLVLARVTTETGRFTLIISSHRDGYHAFAGVAGQPIQGIFPTFAAAWEFALDAGLVRMATRS